MPKMKASDYIATFLRVQQTSHVFEVAGGMITHMLDSIYQLGNMNIISVHHEQSAAFAADAYGRHTKRPGVALATSGPGATNLLTGVGSCYFDSSPALFITGQVNTYECKKDRPIRQLGFQETDIVSMAKPITKKSYQVQSPDQLETAMQELYTLAISDRPGPVLIDIPMDIQRAIIDVEDVQYLHPSKTQAPLVLDDSLDHIFEALKKAKKPLILAGQGVSCSNATEKFLQLVDLLQIPVVTSLLGLDLLPFKHPLRIGMIGSYGNRWANMALGTCDLLIVIGSRLDIRQTGADAEGFARNKTIFHIDCDTGEINNRIKNCIPIVSDAEYFIREALSYFQNKNAGDKKEWLAEIRSLQIQWPDTKELKDFSGINPNQFVHALSSNTPQYAAFVADVGNHQMWAAQSLELYRGQSFITTGGMGAMGFALPAAIGYSLAAQKKPVVVIAGDGAFQMNIQELQTIIRNRLPIKIVIINNNALGMIRQFQDSYFNGRYQSTYWGYSAPDFAAIAKAYGLATHTISEPDEIDAGVAWLHEDPASPALLQVMVSPHMNVYPKIAFGKPITEMEPFAKPSEMECT
ncbi:MAG TPA: thiamine pyrophosphate-binding protein [Gammaproteobacteria bacterium]|nr:thiamine pyrophosphate-binding protein [Gammaproteobacteria bacterium]